MRIKGYSDLFIRWLFGAEENNEYLLSFLNALQDYQGREPLRSVKVRNPFLLQRAYDDKLAVLDVLAEDEKGLKLNVEVQASNHPGFEERTLYYWARVYAGQIDSGDQYTRLTPVVGVNIVNFVLFPEIPRPVNTFHLTHDQHPDLRLSEHLTVHYLELPKLAAESVPDRNSNAGWPF
ncbi:MAG: Rpn family recombination-promoting nuclease/putative transposase [Spirochaetales bacterium]